MATAASARAMGRAGASRCTNMHGKAMSTEATLAGYGTGDCARSAAPPLFGKNAQDYCVSAPGLWTAGELSILATRAGTNAKCMTWRVLA